MFVHFVGMDAYTYGHYYETHFLRCFGWTDVVGFCVCVSMQEERITYTH